MSLVLGLASSIAVLGLKRFCPWKGCPWPWIFLESLALAWSFVSSTPPLVYNIGLKRKIKETRSSLKLAETKYVNSKQIIFQLLSLFEKQCLVYLLEKHFQNLINNTLKSHQNKLCNLWREQRIRSPKFIISLSSKKLTLQEEEVLRFGLVHHISPRKLNLASLQIYAERLFSNIKR